MRLKKGLRFQRGMSLGGRLGAIIFRMVIDMDESRLQTISQLRAFLAGALEVRFCVPDNDDARYAHIVAVAVRLDYAKLKRPHKGVVLRYLQRTSGYSRAQLTRLLMRVVHGASLHKRYRSPAHAFARGYTPGGTGVLAEGGRAPGTPPGPGTGALLCRACGGGLVWCIWFVGHGLVVMPASSAWPTCRSRTCTTCVPARSTKPSAGASTGRGRSPIPSDCAARRARRDVQASSASTRSTRATWTAPRGSTTSTPWTSSPSGRCWPAASASAKPTCCPPWRPSSSSSPS